MRPEAQPGTHQRQTAPGPPAPTARTDRQV